MNTSYDDPELIKRICELKNSGKSWLNITGIILEEFDIKISSPTIKNIYERTIAKSMIIQSEKEGNLASEIVPNYQKMMEERFNRISKVTDDLMDTLSELKRTMEPEVYIKYIPTILMVCREILNQLNFIKKEQSQVLVNQKNLIYSPLQIMNIVSKQMEELEKEGKIKIIQVSKLTPYHNRSSSEQGRVLTDEEKLFSRTKTAEEIEMEQRQKKSKKTAVLN